jgi:hypothetical protein
MSPRHGSESDQTHGISVELSHLTEHVGLLHAMVRINTRLHPVLACR